MYGLRKECGKSFYNRLHEPDYLACSITRCEHPRLSSFSSERPEKLVSLVSEEIFAAVVQELNSHLDAHRQLGEAESTVGAVLGALLGGCFGYRCKDLEKVNAFVAIAMGSMIGAYALANLLKDRRRAQNILVAARDAQNYFDGLFTTELLRFNVMPILHAHCDYNPSCRDSLDVTKASHIFFRIVELGENVSIELAPSSH